MKKTLVYIFLGLVLGLVWKMSHHEEHRPVVILSTNDIHSKIDKFPLLATAVAQARDTAEVILVDAGDRWQGNAFVDLVEHRRPVIELMNKVGFDVATLGNHEFDGGQATVDDMIRLAEFDVICANFHSDTVAVRQTAPYTIFKRGGMRIGFVGVVTNYERNGYPDGLDENYAGLRFDDPQKAAVECAKDHELESCDALILISHMGDGYDLKFAAENDDYNAIIGGHSHRLVDTVVNGVQVSQALKYLTCVGATTLSMGDDGKVKVDYRNISLANYDRDEQMDELVAGYYANPDLLKRVGSIDKSATTIGLANLFTSLMVEELGVDFAIYHLGGVRLDALPKGDVSSANIFDVEPFGTRLHTIEVTPEELAEVIVNKYNKDQMSKESFRVDIVSSVPYVIETESDDKYAKAVGVKFEGLTPNKVYKVALGKYMFDNYGFTTSESEDSGLTVGDLLHRAFEQKGELKIDNVEYQTICPRK